MVVGGCGVAPYWWTVFRTLVVQRLATRAHALLARTEGAEVLGSLGHGVGEELHHHLASRLTANLDVKENLRSWVLMVRREIEVGRGAFELGTVGAWWRDGGGTVQHGVGAVCS